MDSHASTSVNVVKVKWGMWIWMGGGLPGHCCFFFFFLLVPVGVPVSNQFGNMEEEAKGSYAWLFHWLWWSCTTWFHSMSNSHVTSGVSPFHVSFQEAAAFPWVLKYIVLLFSLLPNKKGHFSSISVQPGATWHFPNFVMGSSPEPYAHICVLCTIYVNFTNMVLNDNLEQLNDKGYLDKNYLVYTLPTT